MVRTQVGIYSIVITLLFFSLILVRLVIGSERGRRSIYCAVFSVWCVALLWLTLFSRQAQPEQVVLGIPFDSYSSAHQGYLENCAVAAKDGIITGIERLRSFLYGYNWIILNVYLFIPYGLLVPKVFPKLSCTCILLYGMAGSAVIEFAQYAFRLGCLDIDDFIHNTIGICIGYALSILVGAINGLKPEKKIDQDGVQNNG